MREKDNKYDRDTMISAYRQKEFEAIPEDMLVDIIPSIQRDNSYEMAVLGLWQHHFQKLGVPYAITAKTAYHGDRSIAYYSLWKERRI